jgi:hypothetical protein
MVEEVAEGVVVAGVVVEEVVLAGEVIEMFLLVSLLNYP